MRNIGSSGASVTLDYRISGQSPPFPSSSLWISAGSSGTFYLPTVFPNDWGTYGTAKVSTTSSQPLISMAGTTKYGSDIASSYSSVLSSDGTGAVVLPIVYNNSGGKITGVQVHNVGSQATNVTITYYGTSGSVNCGENPIQVDAGEGYAFYLPSGCTSAGFEGSAVVTADGGDERIVAIANHTNYGGSYAFSYNGVNR